jgi:hypothetical protein
LQKRNSLTQGLTSCESLTAARLAEEEFDFNAGLDAARLAEEEFDFNGFAELDAARRAEKVAADLDAEVAAQAAAELKDAQLPSIDEKYQILLKVLAMLELPLTQEQKVTNKI